MWEVYEVLWSINKNIYITAMNLSTGSGFVRKRKHHRIIYKEKERKGIDLLHIKVLRIVYIH